MGVIRRAQAFLTFDSLFLFGLSLEEASDLLERSGGCWRQWEMRLAQLKDADKFFRVAFMPCYGIFLAAKFSQIEAYAHADE